MSLETSLETSLEKIVAALSDEGVELKDRLRSALEIAETALSPEARAERMAFLERFVKIDLRREIVNELAYIAGYEKWDNKSSREIAYEVTEITLGALSMTNGLSGQKVYGALGEDLKTALASTFKRLRDELLEDHGEWNSWKDKTHAAEEFAQVAMAVIRPLALTLNLLDSVGPANRPILDEAIGRGMLVQWMLPDNEGASEPFVFSVLGKSGSYVAGERGMYYSEAMCEEVAKLIFGAKEPADLRPVDRIEFNRQKVEWETAYWRKQAQLTKESSGLEVSCAART
jgi:hypothetical protein